MNPDAVKHRPFYNLRQMLEVPAKYYFKHIDNLNLIEVIIRVAIGKHREWIHNRDIDKFQFTLTAAILFINLFFETRACILGLKMQIQIQYPRR